MNEDHAEHCKFTPLFITELQNKYICPKKGKKLGFSALRNLRLQGK